MAINQISIRFIAILEIKQSGDAIEEADYPSKETVSGTVAQAKR